MGYEENLRELNPTTLENRRYRCDMIEVLGMGYMIHKHAQTY